jgi:hypothetical protein
MSITDTSQSIDDTPDLQILGAAYGRAKVTAKVIALVDRTTAPQSLQVVASNAVFGDSWHNIRKTLTVVYRYGEVGAPHVAAVKEGETLRITGATQEADRAVQEIVTPQLTIFGATYGPGDVTPALDALIDRASQSLSVTADNATFGDTWVGVPKTLVVVAAYEHQVPFTDVVVERDHYALKYRPPLRILSGYWGQLDVTAILQANIRQRTLTIGASDATFGDGWPGVTKSLSVVYQYGDETPQLAIAEEGATLAIDYHGFVGRYTPPPDPRALNVLKASYGRADVTSKVASLVRDDELQFTADNALFGDSWPQVPKSFTMAYSWGPTAPRHLMVPERASVRVSQPALRSPLRLLTLAGLFANGDHVAVAASNDAFWTLGAGGQIVASAPSRSEATTFTIAGVTAMSAQMVLQAPDGTFVGVGGAGALHSGASREGAAPLIASLTGRGAIVLSVLGLGRTFCALTEQGTIIAAGSDETTFATSFALQLEATAEGLASHLELYAEGAAAAAALPVSPELLAVVWDLTGGWFLALGLGPLIGGGVPKAGIVALIRANARANAALNAMIQAVENNPEVSLGAAFVAFAGILWDEGIMWAVLRMAFSAAGWWALAAVATKVLEWTLLPEVEAAEIVVSFGIWVYRTMTDIIALVNSGSATALAADERDAPAPVAAAAG